MKDISPISIKQVHERIPLTPQDRSRLSKLIFTKRFYFVITYLTISVVIAIAWMFALERGDNWKEESQERIIRLAPYFFIGSWVILTIYFIRTYYLDIHPFVKDLRSDYKEVFYFKADKYQTPFFHEFFLETPLERAKLIRIDKTEYDSIRPDSNACIMYGKYSEIILGVLIDDRVIR